jgi:hypothetical protein
LGEVVYLAAGFVVIPLFTTHAVCRDVHLMRPTDVVSCFLQAKGKSSHSVPGVIGFVTIPGGVELGVGAVPEKVAAGN